MKRIAVAALAALLLCAGHLEAGKFNKKLNVGDPAPTWKGLVGIDDKPHSLADYEKAKVVVIAFTCNHCPVAVAYEDRFMHFVKEYEPRGMKFIAINSNLIEADLPDKMKERAKERKFNFEYLFDANQDVAASFGATVTPHLFVLDKERRIAFMGGFDDTMMVDEIKHNYVRDAVDALLADKKPEVTESRQFGCGIQYEKAKKPE
ncbi:MAG: thioredoxin family protein [Planctomycetaceae bacterium]